MPDLDYGFTLGAVLTTAGAAIAGAAVAALVEMLKQIIFPETWLHGRAPMATAAGLAALLVFGALVDAGAMFSDPNTYVAGTLSWLTVTTAAIGTHSTVRKAATAVQSGTNRAGPDDERG